MLLLSTVFIFVFTCIYLQQFPPDFYVRACKLEKASFFIDYYFECTLVEVPTEKGSFGGNLLEFFLCDLSAFSINGKSLTKVV